MNSISLDDAKKLIELAQKEAYKLNKPVTVAIVDPGGYLIALERMEGARPLQPSIATAKAYTGAVMQRPGHMLKGWATNQPGFFAEVAKMGMHPIVATEGAMTIKKNGELIGGLGLAGGTGDEDQQICEAILGEAGFDLEFDQFNSIKK